MLGLAKDVLDHVDAGSKHKHRASILADARSVHASILDLLRERDEPGSEEADNCVLQELAGLFDDIGRRAQRDARSLATTEEWNR